MHRTPSEWGNVLVAGIIAGIAAGVALTLVMLGVAIAIGQDPWLVAKSAALPFLGAAASTPGFDLTAVLVATLAHFAVAVAWGVLFALLLYRAPKAITVMAGPFFGVLVFIAMFYAVLPAIGLVS